MTVGHDTKSLPLCSNSEYILLLITERQEVKMGGVLVDFLI